MNCFLALVLVLVAAGGCVWVGRGGVYSRQDTLEQGGTNTANKHLEIEIPKL